MQKFAHQTRSFDGFMLDLTRGCLLRGEEEVKRRAKSFEVLKPLVENSGRLVRKEELIEAFRVISWIVLLLPLDVQHFFSNLPKV
jgi:DNA-binding winged helix-turn-helix (wHTH) protein